MNKIVRVYHILVMGLLAQIPYGYGMDQKKADAVVIEQEEHCLYKAMATGNPQEVQMLIDRGETCNVIGRGGTTPLHWMLDEKLEISIESRIAMLDMLLKAGADVNMPNDALKTVVHEAMLSKLPDALQLFQFLYDRSITGDLIDIEGQTPLHAAVAQGRVDAVQHMLFSKKASLEARDFKQRTPLQIAFEEHLPADKKSVIVHDLLEAGANIEVEDSEHTPLLFNVINRVDLSGVELLLSHGANVHASNLRGQSICVFAQEKVQKSDSPEKAQKIVALVQEYIEGKRVPRARIVPADHYSNTYITIPIPQSLYGKIDTKKLKANIAAILMASADGNKSLLQLGLEKSFRSEQKEQYE